MQLTEETAVVVCKWYRPLLSAKANTYNIKHAYYMTVDEPKGFKDTPGCDAILTAVKMVHDVQHDCFLLLEADRAWAEQELKRNIDHNKKFAMA